LEVDKLRLQLELRRLDDTDDINNKLEKMRMRAEQERSKIEIKNERDKLKTEIEALKTQRKESVAKDKEELDYTSIAERINNVVTITLNYDDMVSISDINKCFKKYEPRVCKSAYMEYLHENGVVSKKTMYVRYLSGLRLNVNVD
jgi:hypothetical protein